MPRSRHPRRRHKHGIWGFSRSKARSFIDQLTAGPSALPRDGQKLEQIHESVLLPPCHAIGLETGTAAQDYI
ncbi:MAG TPA: hypothetical protein VJK29_10820 [Terriglobales bacterium]|nr:hypothetical protein [Terriglobales bacterium]